jgi:hypothetical protein
VPLSATSRRAQLNQSRTFESGRVLGTTNCAAIVPDTYWLQAGHTDNTTGFHNYLMFHEASLERIPTGGNALFVEGDSCRGVTVRHWEFAAYRGREMWLTPYSDGLTADELPTRCEEFFLFTCRLLV